MKYRITRGPDGEWIIADVWKRGHAILSDPLLNKGTAFTPAERERFDLDGMLPYQHTVRERQVQRGYEHLQDRGENPLEKYVSMMGLLDRNETLFYQVLAGHVEELLPIVYTPTVGHAAVKYSHLFRRGRGLWITPDHQGRIFDVLGHARSEEIKLIVVTDNERILGLGDQGVGGMVIPIGKLALYTLGAGIHPAYTLPVSLDVGTDNESLLSDDMYVGWRHPRLRGEEYYELVDEFVDAVRRRWPQALLQWEDFKKTNAFVLLDRYRDVLPSFNDDIQGTAAVVVAGVLAYCRAREESIGTQRIVLLGAGAAGVGIARQLIYELEAADLTDDAISRSLALVDSRGLIVNDREDLEAPKESLAMAVEVARDLQVKSGMNLQEVIEALEPTILIGTTGQPGAFTEEAIRAMARGADRPLIMALSNPTSKTEANPSDVAEWSDGRAFIATGSPFAPVDYQGRSIAVSQCNNVYVFPGVGLGAIVSATPIVTDAMFGSAARTLANMVDDDQLSRGVLYPPLADLRPISRTIAAAVIRQAVVDGDAPRLSDGEVDEALDQEIWDLDYPSLQPA
jgi:malate dehydrogenase (oxaloacetate-decarboxylating)